MDFKEIPPSHSYSGILNTGDDVVRALLKKASSFHAAPPFNPTEPERNGAVDVLSGLNRRLARTFGAPVDLMTGLLNAVILGGATGLGGGILGGSSAEAADGR